MKTPLLNRLRGIQKELRPPPCWISYSQHRWLLRLALQHYHPSWEQKTRKPKPAGLRSRAKNH